MSQYKIPHGYCQTIKAIKNGTSSEYENAAAVIFFRKFVNEIPLLDHINMCFYKFDGGITNGVPKGNLELIGSSSENNYVEDVHWNEDLSINAASTSMFSLLDDINFHFVYFTIDELICAMGKENDLDVLYLTDDHVTYSNMNDPEKGWNSNTKFGTLLASPKPTIISQGEGTHAETLCLTEGKPCPPFWKAHTVYGTISSFLSELF